MKEWRWWGYDTRYNLIGIGCADEWEEYGGYCAEWIWGQSPNRGREAPEIWGLSPNRGRSPRLSGREGSVSPSPEFFENSYRKPCNLVYSWSENLSFSQRIQEFSEDEREPDFDPSQIQLCTWEHESCNLPSGVWGGVSATNDFGALKNALFRRGMIAFYQKRVQDGPNINHNSQP